MTSRQREILALAAAGCPDKEIAIRLGLALPTVRTYWQRFFRANHVNTRVAAAVLYERSSYFAGNLAGPESAQMVESGAAPSQAVKFLEMHEHRPRRTNLFGLGRSRTRVLGLL